MTDERKKELSAKIKEIAEELQMIAKETGLGMTIDAMPLEAIDFPIMYVFYDEGQDTVDGKRMVMAYSNELENVLFIDRDDTVRLSEVQKND